MQGRSVILEQLLAHGADMTVRDEDGRTALFYALEVRFFCPCSSPNVQTFTHPMNVGALLVCWCRFACLLTCGAV